LADARAWRAALTLATMTNNLGGSNTSDDAFSYVSSVMWTAFARAIVVILSSNIDSIVIAVVASVIFASSVPFPIVIHAVIICSAAVNFADTALIIVVFLILAGPGSFNKFIRRLNSLLNNDLLRLRSLSDDDGLRRRRSSFLDDDGLWCRLRKVLGRLGVLFERVRTMWWPQFPRDTGLRGR
jgi:hypothetical protein